MILDQSAHIDFKALQEFEDPLACVFCCLYECGERSRFAMFEYCSCTNLEAAFAVIVNWNSIDFDPNFSYAPVAALESNRITTAFSEVH